MAGLHVGVDVGKRFHYICAMASPEEVVYRGQVPQDEAEIRAALESIGDPADMLVAVDQPNNIGALVVAVALSIGCDVRFIPSKRMREEAERQGRNAKTDRIDAEVIAVATYEAARLFRPVSTEETRQRLRALRSRDRDLAHDEVRAVNRLRAALLEDMPAFEAVLEEGRVSCSWTLAMLVEFGGPWGMADHARAFRNRCADFTAKVPSGLEDDARGALGAQTIRPKAWREMETLIIPRLAKEVGRLRAERAEIAKATGALLAGDATYKALLTVPGIGPKTAATLCADLDPDCFGSPFAMASYCGLAPEVRKSGTSINSRKQSRGGNRRLRDAMFMSTFAAINHDPFCSSYYFKKRAQGKSYAAAVISLARKRMKVIYAIMKSGQPYEERPHRLLETV